MEAKELLIQLIQAKTVNADRSEWIGIDILRKWLLERGLDSRVFWSPGERPNLVAKLPATSGGAKKPPLVLLSHMDVVSADDGGWSYPPFGGIEAEGAIWGRGALDTKQLTAMHAHAFYHLSKQENRSREVCLVVTADEENGSAEGMAFLAKEQPGLFENATVFSEGGGFLLEDPDNGTVYMLYANSEKGVATICLTAEMEGGHAAAPPDDSLIPCMLETASRIAAAPMVSAVNRDLVHFRSKIQADVESEQSPDGQKELARRLIDYMKGPSVKIPEFEIGSGSINVLPAKGKMILEIRVLPEATEEAVKAFLQETVDDPRVKWEVISFEPGYQNAPDDLLIEIFEATAEEFGFQGEWVPFTALGRTDGRWIAESADSIYGISPTLTDFTEVLKRVHQQDERIETESFEFGSKWMDKVVVKVCG